MGGIVFDEPVTAGTVLIREAIQSQDYVQGSQGWKIPANGDVEFNNGTFRGTVTASQIVGSVFASSQTDPSIWLNEDAANSLRVYDGDGDKVVEIGAGPGQDAYATFYDPTAGTALGIGQAISWLSGSSILTQRASMYDSGTAILLNTILNGGIGFDYTNGRLRWVIPGSDTLETRHTPGAGPGGSGNYTAGWSGSTAYNGSLNWDALTYERKDNGYGSLTGCFTAASGAGNTVFMLPVGYRPTRQIPVWIERNAGGVNSGFMGQVTPAGNLNIPAQTGGGVASGNQYLINAEFPLN
jgi:hypothetical protein